MEQASSLFTSLLEAQRAQAFERFTIIHLAIEEVITPAAVAYTHHISLRTILGRIKNYGAQGLADLVRVDKGTSRSFPQTTIRLIEGLALQRPPHSAVSIHQQVTTIATEQSWNSSGYASVCQIIKDLESALVILAYEGGETNWEGFELLYCIEATHTNPRWQADYTPLAIWLLNEEGKLAKPWLTIIFDDYSRAVASFPLTFQILTVLTTVLTLCQVVIQGYPQEFLDCLQVCCLVGKDAAMKCIDSWEQMLVMLLEKAEHFAVCQVRFKPCWCKRRLWMFISCKCSSIQPKSVVTESS